MKKMKKILAMFLAMAMVLGMSMTTFAAKGDAGTITVEGAGTGAVYTIAQIIKEDTSAKTGWAFVNADMASAFLNVFFKNQVATDTKAKAEQEQKIIYRLLKKESDTVKEPKWDDNTTGLVAADAADIQTALKTIMTSQTISFTEFTNGGTVSSAGLYAIKVGEAGYAYSPITAYIAPGATLGHAEPKAKRVRLGGDDGDGPLTKEHNGDNDSAAIGETVEYTITAMIPYLPEGSTGVVFEIKDEISGAKYVTPNPDADVSNTNKPILDSVKIVSTNADVSNKASVKDGALNNSFTIDLTSILENNTYVNEQVEIKYRAKVTGDYVRNTATANYGTLFDYTYPDPSDPNPDEPTPPSDVDVLYTGSITMTKKGEGDAPIGGAQFKVYFKGTIADDGTISTTTGDTVYYAILNNDKVTGWTTDESLATTVTSETVSTEGNTKGTVKVSGLKYGVDYMFKEVKAPANYSINTTDEKVTWDTLTEEAWKALTDEDFSAVKGHVEMTDTVLASLPSTGGIGTTIFTVGGCAIMIIAAGLYFASRRRAAK